MSDFVKSLPKPGRAEFDEDEEPARALPPLGARADGQLSEQSKALADFYKATADELIDKLAQVIEGLQQVKREGDTRHEALSGKIDTLGRRLRGEVPRFVLRRIWVRSFVAWGMLVVGVFVWQPQLVPTTSLWVRKQGTALWTTVSGWVWGPSAVSVTSPRKSIR